ncbi:MAG TPA: chaperone modulator CbpM [Solirubrobacteraceae bacterium]|jgi:chaperone modulatory protein CbpM|nr:chaperone modulator CbpM [Solirubrobacteraceae bacterium]
MSGGGPAAQRQPDGSDHLERPIELTVVARQAGLRVSVVRRYLMLGLFEPSGGTNRAPLFAPSAAARVAKADRLRRDLELNLAGAVLACELLDRIRELETRDPSNRGTTG